jgi:predicted Zn-dependent protease
MLRFIILLLGISLALLGCATTYNPATEQQEFIFITTATEVSLGKALFTKISDQYKISKDPGKIDRVRKIGEKIAKVSDRKDLVHHFNVIEDKGLNAFTTPGGYVYVNSGVIEDTSDDELACVIGHEVGHVAARHVAKKLQAQIGYDILMNIAVRNASLGDFQKAVSISYDLISLGYSREDELLSDRLGVKYAYKSGYDPYAMIQFLKRLEDAKKQGLGLVFLRSHPYASERINVLKTEISGIINKAEDRVVTGSSRPLKAMCPVCGRIFSGKSRYCPYDGSELP